MPVYTKQEDDALYPADLSLTEGEVALVKSIFGDEIDTDIVKKSYSARYKPGKDKGAKIPAQTFGKDSIRFYGAQYIQEDYSQIVYNIKADSNIFNFGCFIHEMTHIWQNQNDVPNKALEGENGYQYTLKAQSTFDDFGWEQQACLIEDYAREFLYPGKNRCAVRSFGKDDPRTLLLLQDVVEKRFPQAAETREALEAKRAAIAAAQPKGLTRLFKNLAARGKKVAPIVRSLRLPKFG